MEHRDVCEPCREVRQLPMAPSIDRCSQQPDFLRSTRRRTSLPKETAALRQNLSRQVIALLTFSEMDLWPKAMWPTRGLRSRIPPKLHAPFDADHPKTPKLRLPC